MSNDEVSEIIETLDELKEDITVPKNVRIKIQGIITGLKEEIELPIKVSKALTDIDEIIDDINLQSYTRTQIWNVISLLEKIN